MVYTKSILCERIKKLKGQCQVLITVHITDLEYNIVSQKNIRECMNYLRYKRVYERDCAALYTDEHQLQLVGMSVIRTRIRYVILD